MTRYTAVFRKEGKWWVGYLEELPGANTQGRTLEETRENLKDAARLILAENRRLARREARGKIVVREELAVGSR